MRLGLRRGTVRVVAHDAAWRSEFEAEKRRLALILGSLARGIEHVGSTAVPRLASKPIIDIAVGLPRLKDARRAIRLLERAGYEFPAPRVFIRANYVVVKGPPYRRTHYIHLIRHRGLRWRRYLWFRDALARDRRLIVEYAALKRALARKFPDDRFAYTNAKDAFIRRTLARGSG